MGLVMLVQSSRQMLRIPVAREPELLCSDVDDPRRIPRGSSWSTCFLRPGPPPPPKEGSRIKATQMLIVDLKPVFWTSWGKARMLKAPNERLLEA